ncbi:MAG: GcvT family protein [Actinomycetes bacterium]
MAAIELPERARVVVVGGGVGGLSVAYHLAVSGERDVLVLERAELTSGSTFHSAGLVGVLRADPTLTEMNRYSVRLYEELEAGEHPPGFIRTGGLRLAASADRLAEIRRQAGWARAHGMELAEISAAEAAALFPLIRTDGVLAAAWLPGDGQVDPSRLAYSLAAGARARGVRIAEGTRVTGIDVRDGRVVGVRTDRGDVAAEVVVNAAGMFAAEIGRMAGVRVPVVPMSHQYVVTEPAGTRAVAAAAGRAVLPTLRDPDLLVYFRQEVDGLVYGGYERDPAPFSADGFGYEQLPADFNARLLAEDWPRFEQIATNAVERVPALADVGIRQLVNGPEGFTPDNEFVLGESSVAGFFVAAGFCAHGIAGAGGIGMVMASWILDGEAPMDLSHMDVRRFDAAYASPGYTLARTVESYQRYYDISYPGRQRDSRRGLRVSPAYSWHVEHEAVFEEKAGWERVGWYEPNAADGPDEESVRPYGFAGRYFSRAIGAEHAAARTGVAIFDESSFAKLEVSGSGAARLLNRLCDNQVDVAPGRVVYTQMLNSRGGIEADLTVTRLDERRFLVITGTASGTRDLAWITGHAPHDGSVDVRDVTGGWACFAVWGPGAPEVLAAASTDLAGDRAIAPRQGRPVVVADVPLLALGMSFVGEAGAELYCPAEYGRALWQGLIAAGAPHGIVPAGYRAIDSLRLEKGYRVWGSDLTPETTPDEAGLSFCVRLDKPDGFLGRDALARAREQGPTRRLRALVLAEPHEVVLGHEPVWHDDRLVGRVTSGGYGYTAKASIAYAYLPAELEPGARVAVELYGRRVAARVVADPVC